jgi:cation diffusion facilitator family transporter
MGAPERTAQRIAMLSLAVSAGLAAVKITVGLAAHSVAVVSDGVESAGDGLASGLVLLGLWVASKPPDTDHPYGHGRFETLTGLAIGGFLAVVGTAICLRSIEQRNDAHALAAFAIWPLIGSIVVKAVLSAIKYRVGTKTGSSALSADASHDLTDVLSSAAALTGVTLALTRPEMAAADHYSGFAIGLIVIFMGAQVVRQTALQLMDTMPDPSQMDQIRTAALRVPGAMAIEKCFARKTGLRFHVDLHLEVNPNLTVSESHDIATAVRIAVKEDVPWVEDVLVHVEPYDMRKVEATIKR